MKLFQQRCTQWYDAEHLRFNQKHVDNAKALHEYIVSLFNQLTLKKDSDIPRFDFTAIGKSGIFLCGIIHIDQLLEQLPQKEDQVKAPLISLRKVLLGFYKHAGDYKQSVDNLFQIIPQINQLTLELYTEVQSVKELYCSIYTIATVALLKIEHSNFSWVLKTSLGISRRDKEVTTLLAAMMEKIKKLTELESATDLNPI